MFRHWETCLYKYTLDYESVSHADKDGKEHYQLGSVPEEK